MATKILNPFQSVAPDQTVAMAAQIHDEVENKKQSQINAELRGEFADLELTSDDLDAIINEVDTDAPYITFTDTEGTGDSYTAYRHPADDVSPSSGEVEDFNCCFSTTGGVKFFLRNGVWTDAVGDTPASWTGTLVVYANTSSEGSVATATAHGFTVGS